MTKAAKTAPAKETLPLDREVRFPIWLSVSSAAQLTGLSGKTVRRAISDGQIRFKIINNRYLVDLRSLLRHIHARTKLRNKLSESGLGQYVAQWRP